jgi:hypothetical protein
MDAFEKTYRFAWRFLINVACISEKGRNLLFPPEKLSAQFGRGDAEYAWQVFMSHFQNLRQNGFDAALRVMEVGPGNNLGTSTLWWCYLSGRQKAQVEIWCWDVFKNASPEAPGYWSALAKELQRALPPRGDTIDEVLLADVSQKLTSIINGVQPAIHYRVTDMDGLMKETGRFDLVYSQAAIEHIWFIEQFWEKCARLSSEGCWHSHRIDLADHGRRDTNFLEMLQWSDWAYWMTQRFVPGGLNRWRASDHLRKVGELGFKVLQAQRDVRDRLPVPRNSLVQPFRNLDEVDLRTTGLSLVAQKVH